MATVEPDPAEVQEVIDKVSSEIDGAPIAPPPAQKQEEIYRLDPTGKVPVSKKEGNVWKGRRDAGVGLLTDLRDGWREAENYYMNAQQNHRKDTAGNKDGTRAYAKNRRDSFSKTENVVYATVNAVIPNTYAKNPNVEITMAHPEQEQIGVMLEHLCNRLAAMKSSPGINLKPKVKKCIVRCEVTNEAWAMFGWVKREDSSEQALADIKRIGDALVNADEKEIRELEGQLMALEETIDLFNPPGPFLRTLHGTQVIVDSDAVEDDYSDAKWMLVECMFATSYLNARYRVKQKDGQYGSAYKPTHIVDAASNEQNVDTVQRQIDTFKIFDINAGEEQMSRYGYSTKQAYEKAQRTKCYYVFDKLKRRFMLYADNDWTWPIWVFEDPYHLPNFFPLARLIYHTAPNATRSRGEVSHYLDQQDSINTIADEKNRARTALRDKTIFNSTHFTLKEIEDLMLNPNKKLVGLKWPEGLKLEDVVGSQPMPNLQYEHLWDKSQDMQAINMISGIGEAMRGEQYKTNTTNGAIEQYSSINGMRLDEKRDAIEDFVGEIMEGILFLALQFMDAEMMTTIVGPQYAPVVQQFTNMEPQAIRSSILCEIEGGSTQKPTSAAKKAEALQMGQIMGQFASASPVVLLFVLKIFQRAFDMSTVTDQDWQMLTASIMQAIQAQSAPAEGEGGEEDAENAKQAVEALVEKGIPREQAIAKVKERLQQRGSGPQTKQ